MWVHQATLDYMHSIIKKQHTLKPRLDYCNKEQLEELWEENLYQLDLYNRLVDISNNFDEERILLKKIDYLEQELNEIDRLWSKRF